jgi:hypothetical protein
MGFDFVHPKTHFKPVVFGARERLIGPSDRLAT